MFARYASKALFASAAVAATLLVAVAPASAQIRTRAVSYADLNLESDAGVKTLNHRVKAAARIVCGTTRAPGYAEVKDMMDCRERAMSSANRAVVTVLAAVKSGDQLALRSGTISVGSD